jgi:hypothetical protein
MDGAITPEIRGAFPMVRILRFAPALIAVLLPFAITGQSPSARPAIPPAIPKDTLPPILTPWEEAPVTNEAANGSFLAHRVIGNIYYVGTADYASFLITSDQGHILINPDFESSVPLIQKSVEQSAFDFRILR